MRFVVKKRYSKMFSIGKYKFSFAIGDTFSSEPNKQLTRTIFCEPQISDI